MAKTKVKVHSNFTTKEEYRPSQEKIKKLTKDLVKSKLKDSFLFLFALLGVTIAILLFSVATLHSDGKYTFNPIREIATILGLLLTPLIIIIREIKHPKKYHMVVVEPKEITKEDKDFYKDPKPPYVKIYFSYLLSTLAVFLIVSGFLIINEEPLQFFIQLIIGLIIAICTRYNFKNHKIINVMEDLVYYILTWSVIPVATFMLLTIPDHPIFSIVIFVIALGIAPLFFISRIISIDLDDTILNTKNYLTTLVSILGVILISGSLFLFISSLIVTNDPSASVNVSQVYKLASEVFIVVGFMFLLGGNILNPYKKLISLKSIL